MDLLERTLRESRYSLQRILLGNCSCDVASAKRQVVKFALIIRHHAILIDPNNRSFFL